LPVSLIGSFYSFFYDISPEHAREFFNQVGTGENITNNSVSLLRKVLLTDKISKRKLQTKHRNALIIKSWNAFRKNDQFKSLRFDVDNDAYPKPI
jgi:ERCC4-type nuclease